MVGMTARGGGARGGASGTARPAPADDNGQEQTVGPNGAGGVPLEWMVLALALSVSLLLIWLLGARACGGWLLRLAAATFAPRQPIPQARTG